MTTKMQFFRSMALIVLTAILSSCIVIHTERSTPPGHAKQITGKKSARTHAPGQIKKHTKEQSAKRYAPGRNK